MAESPLDSPADPAPVAVSSGGSVRQQAIRGAALLSFRQILVGIVTVGGIIVLPLLLGPAEFSLYGYVNTAMLVGAAVGDLGLGASIIKNRMNDRDLERSFALQLSFWALTGILLLVGAYFADPFGFAISTSALLVLCLVFFSLQALPTALLEKEMQFKRISAIEILQRVILVVVAIGLAVVHPTEWSIPLAALVAALVGYPSFLRAARWRWLPKWGGGEPIFRGFSSQWWQVRIATQMAYAAYPLLGGLLFSARDVGLIVWALAISSIPAYLAPMVARASFPALSRSKPAQRARIYSPLFRGLLLIGTPLIAGLLVTAGPLTRDIFGEQWVDAIPLLRLESITSLIGIATASVIPFVFLSLPHHHVKWICVATTISIVVIGTALAPLVGYLAISIATILASSSQLLAFDFLLRRKVGYSLLRDMFPALTGLAIGVAVGLPFVLLSDALLVAVAAGSLAAIIQTAVTWALKGGVSLNAVLTEIRRRDPAAPPGN